MEIAPKQIDARHVKPPASGEPGIVVVNPPYGERVGVRGADLASDFFAEFGNTLKQRFAGWQVYVLTSDLAFQKKLRLAPKKRIPLFNGAIECRLYAFDLVAGSNRRTAVKG
jgi:putative N6-adenine-specific DNA methylase